MRGSLTWPPCRTLLLDTLVLSWQFCRTLSLDKLSRHACKTLLLDTLLEHSYTWHSYAALLLGTLIWNSDWTLLCDTFVRPAGAAPRRKRMVIGATQASDSNGLCKCHDNCGGADHSRADLQNLCDNCGNKDPRSYWIAG